MITPALTIELSRDGSYLRLRNTSVFTDVNLLTFCTLRLIRPSRSLMEQSIDLISAGLLAESLTTTGVKIYPSALVNSDGSTNETTRFTDGFYMLVLTMKETAVEYSVTKNEGFCSMVEEVLNRKVVDCMVEVTTPRTRKMRDYTVAQALVRSAKADARVGIVEGFDSKIEHVYRIFAREGVCYE